MKLLAARVLVVAVFIASQWSGEASAYPNYISLGYESCMGCHYNPYGGGPLTDYGRSVGATYIASRMFWKKKASEERIARASGFLWRKPPNDWLRPGLSYRGLYYQVQQPGNTDSRFINMDATASLAMLFGEKQEFSVVGSMSYAPKPQALKNSDEKIDLYRSREHYVGWRISREFGVYAGLMDRIFGLRVPDHTAFSRVIPQQTMNDQSHGVLGHLMLKDWEIGLQGFMGNLAQKDAALRQKGFAAQVEYSLVKRTRLGFSLLSSSSSYLSLMAHALHVRTGLGKFSLLGEFGEVAKKAIESDFNAKSQYLFTQTHWFITRGYFALMTVEYNKPDTTGTLTTMRYGPGFQFFPHHGIEFRIDALNSETKDNGQKVNSFWQYLAQIHLWI